MLTSSLKEQGLATGYSISLNDLYISIIMMKNGVLGYLHAILGHLTKTANMEIK